MDVGSTNFRFTLDDPETKPYTSRWSKTAELHLDSLDRYNVNNVPYVLTLADGGNQVDAKLLGPLYSTVTLPATDKCIIQTKRNLLYGYMSRISLTQMNISYRVPTVTASSGSYVGNNIIGITLNGSPPIPITIPQGFYTVTTLASVLQVLIRAANGALSGAIVAPPTNQNTVSPTSISSGFTVNSGSPTSLIAFARVSTTPATVAASVRCMRLLGINTLGTWGTAAAQILNLGVPNLLPTDYVDVVSQALTNYKDTKDANSSEQSPGSVLGRIWLTENWINNQTATNGVADPNLAGATPMNFCKTWITPNWSQWSPNQAINSVDVSLLDMWGQPLFWSPTFQTEWSATVTVTE